MVFWGGGQQPGYDVGQETVGGGEVNLPQPSTYTIDQVIKTPLDLWF